MLALAARPLATPATAPAVPTLSATAPCYVNMAAPAPITVTGTGWTPGDTVELTTRESSLYGEATAGADGSFRYTFTGGTLLDTDGPSVLAVTLTATDEGNDTTETLADGDTARTAFDITNLAASTTPTEAKPAKKVAFSFSGFTEGKEIYAHYLHRGTVEATAAFGRATGPCGVLKQRARLYPDGDPKFDSYTVQFDDAKRYTKRSAPKLDATVDFFSF